MNTEKLIALITTSGRKRTWIADYLGITLTALSNKLNGRTEFKLSEIEKLRVCLNMSAEDVIEIFFCSDMANFATN